MKHLIWKSFSAAALALVFTSCQEDDGLEESANARVMVVHASPDAPAVDVRVNNAVTLTNVSFPANSMYLNVAAGAANVKVAPTGTNTNVIDANVNLTANEAYTVFAIDSVSKIKAAVVTDNLTTPAAGKAHVRFFHFSPDAPAVDIAVTNGPVLFANRSFNDQGMTGNMVAFTPVDAGTYNLEVRAAGTPTVALAVPNVTLQAGKIYTVFAKGFLGGTGGQALGAQVITHN
ncbi:MAG TPA: DUF4397 domain-containing protein [Chitinophagaceae bacterium]|jgi:hypothetical protein|nr:DUF4397 domain-containing protein [Chitinophagaceae bacterium]